MKDSALSLPWFTSHWWVLGVFGTATVAFHVIFIRLLPLTSIQWKRVDYAWLSLALLGVIAGVANNRSVVATNLVAIAESRTRASLEWAYRRAEFGTSIAICRKFNFTEFSPPREQFERMQREFDAQCGWFTKLVSALGPLEQRKTVPLDPIALAGPRPDGGDQDSTKSFFESVSAYNASLDDLKLLQAARSSDLMEQLIQLLGPALLALALALRITKVTGEIQLEQAKSAREA